MKEPRPKKIHPGNHKQTSLSTKPAQKAGSSLNDMNSFIDNELKNLRKMKRNDLPKPVLNSESVKAKSNLKESMKGANLNDLRKNTPDDQLNSTVNKFEGFTKATKFNDTSSIINPSVLTSNQEGLRASSSKITPSKPEPFIIKFPETKPANEETLSIINSLTKSESKKAMPNIEIKPKEITPVQMIKNDAYSLPAGKMYQPDIKKVENDPDDIPEDYDDFVNEDEIKKIEEERLLALKKEKEIQIKPLVRQMPQGKREQTRIRVNELRNVITLESEDLILFQFDCIKDRDDSTTQAKAKEDIGVNTDKIKTKDCYTETENEKQYTQLIKENESKPKKDANKKKSDNQKESKANLNEDNNKSNIETNYQPLTYKAYQFFIHIGPYIENILLNNTNKYIRQTKSAQTGETTGMTKLDKEFIFPKELLDYLFPNTNESDISFRFTSFLFFDTKPYQIAFAINLTLGNASPLYALLPDINSSCSLVVVYCLFTNQIMKIYYSFSKINEMSLLGESENLLVTAKHDGTFDIYDLRNTDKEVLYQNYESSNLQSITRQSGDENAKNAPSNPKYSLILPSSTFINSGFSLSNPIVSIWKNVIESISTEKVFKLFAVDQSGSIAIFNIRESITNSKNYDEILAKPDILLNVSRETTRVFNTDETIPLQCINMKYLDDEKCYGIIFLLSNIGLAKITIEGKESFIIEPIYDSSFNKMICFDLADTGNICAAFSDYTVKIFDKTNDTLLTAFASSLIPGAVLEQITWSNVICKNAKGKLVRKSLLANFYLFTSKNEFIIYDLNQKNAADIKKIKRKKDLGSKSNLSKKNSQLAISDSLFTDYSNFILQTNCAEHKVEIHKLSLRKQYYEETSIFRVNDKIKDKMLKANS